MSEPSMWLDVSVVGRKKERPSFFSHWKERLSMRSLSRPRAQSAELSPGEKTVSSTDFTYHPPEQQQVLPTSLLTRRSDELIVPQSIAHMDSTMREPDIFSESSVFDKLGAGLSDESEMSGGSTEALHQTSRLVVEVLQNSLKRYFYVPPSLIKTSRVKQLIKSGKKLHILNDHTFVAVKLPSSTSCKVCLKAITTTFRRQGFQCRDCRIMCHKRCYERATGFSCSNSRLSMLHIENFA
uniref:Phorbol-ester/DAG-type domain-containing protein n=1 Tax=Romanomermis culicivorax TaxID=13658 RepID=A0A915J4N5_ROMCU